MSSSNKRAKKRLIRIFGNVDFLEEIGVKRYTGNEQLKKMRTLTYHHLQRQCERWWNYDRKWGVAYTGKSFVVTQAA